MQYCKNFKFLNLEVPLTSTPISCTCQVPHLDQLQLYNASATLAASDRPMNHSALLSFLAISQNLPFSLLTTVLIAIKIGHAIC